VVRRRSNYADSGGRFRYRYDILDDHHALLAVGTDIRTGAQRARRPLRDAGDALRLPPGLRRGPGRPGSENADLFPPDLAEWAQSHAGELALVELRLREAGS
jgi:hypothetical protein